MDVDPTIPSERRHSDRIRQILFHLRDFHCCITLLSNHEPISYKEASTNPLWQSVMDGELQALLGNLCRYFHENQLFFLSGFTK